MPAANDAHLAEALGRITLAMTGTLDAGAVLSAVQRGLVEELDARSCQVFRPGSGDALRLAGHAGLAPPSERPSRRIEAVFRDDEHHCSNALPTNGSLAPAPWLLENGLRAFAGLPLSAHGRVHGVLAVFFDQPVGDAAFAQLFLFARTAAVALHNAEAHAELTRLRDRLEAENRYLRTTAEGELDCGELVGQSASIRAVREQIEDVAPTDTSVLIQGETGTGKELVASSVHRRSRRRGRAFIRVNCGAIAPGLAESTLFGHERGAFTGASERRIGIFELADGGTLFLDEVAELTPELQVKLLRVVQEGELERLGSGAVRRVDVRIIAAGNRDLEAEVRAGRFRADLFYRLNVFPIRLPPLRERTGDIPLIARCLLPKIAARVGKRLTALSEDAVRRLAEYDWPGNVRELINVLERSAIRSSDGVLRIDRAFAPSRSYASSDPDRADPPADLISLDEAQRRHILRALAVAGGRIAGPGGAAELLGLHPNTLRSRMQKLGVR